MNWLTSPLLTVENLTMRFGCLGYLVEGSWDRFSASEREAMMTEVIAFDQARRKSGHWISGMALRGATPD